MAKPKKTTIDLSSYRTTEFVDRVVELVSLPSAIQRIIKFGAYGFLAAIIKQSMQTLDFSHRPFSCFTDSL